MYDILLLLLHFDLAITELEPQKALLIFRILAEKGSFVSAGFAFSVAFVKRDTATETERRRA